MAKTGISYSSKNFADYRSNLIGYVKQYYPDIYNDFNDAAIGQMLIELNAAVSDVLSFHIDKSFNETQLDFAQERESLLSLARTYGLKIPGKRAAITAVDFSCIVPTLGDTFNIAYAPIIRQGTQVIGAGKVFETQEDIDFSSPFSSGGIPNRLILPNVDVNGNITSYTLRKREIVINGVTKIFKKVVTNSDIVPFLEIILPEQNVLSVTSVITLDGSNINTTPGVNQFLDDENRWYEVDALADDMIFVEDKGIIVNDQSIKPGKFVRIDRRFITERTNNNFLKLIFGGGSQDISSLSDYGIDSNIINNLANFINNTSLGTTLSPNTTLFVKYRVGGGENTNIGQGVLNTLGVSDIIVNGPSQNINNSVINSITVTNPIPSLGGKEEPTIEEIRNLIRYNFSAQNRAVTINDYKSIISTMPTQFGIPNKFNVVEEQNKIKIYVLGLNSNGNLKNQNNTILNNNISNYLSNYRMINDYIEITNGKIVNLSVEMDIVIEKGYPQYEIINEVINKISGYFNINNREMGENIYLSPLIKEVNDIKGIVNIIDLRLFNKVGGSDYSMDEISQPYINEETRQIDLLGEQKLFGEPNGFYEIKFRNKDINIRIKN